MGSGRSSGAFSTVEPGAVGKGGGVNITTGALSVKNGAQLRADTNGRGDAGSVNINARDTVSFDGVSSGGFNSVAVSSVRSVGVGKGGDINITTGSLSVTDGAALLASTRGRGDAGSVNISARDTVSFDGGDAFSTVESGAVGKGGDVSITTGALSVTNGAGLSASSKGSGGAGNIEVAASSIHLDNQALLSSETTGGQGNIILRSGDLVLRRGSNITTNAAGTATGGNITIDTGVLAALKNSDITANADEAFGGQVIINAQGIFGTEFREDETSQSDITASSSLGPQFRGTVEINTPDADLSRGLVALPAALVDASNQIAQGCADGGENDFIVTGRGGLPPNPGDTLSADAVLADWATLEPGVENRSGAAPATALSRVSAPTTLMEAQGWALNDKGEVVLTATAPTVTPHIPWMTPASCHALKTSS